MNNLDKTDAIDVADRAQDNDCEKRDWISTYGSDLLRSSLLAGYTSDRRYVEERVRLEYPGFLIHTYRRIQKTDPESLIYIDKSIEKSDSPPAYCLRACNEIVGSYCSEDRWGDEDYYLTIDNYLGENKIFKKIIEPSKVIEVESNLGFEDVELGLEGCNVFSEGASNTFDPYESDKRDWIFSFGSDLLQRSIVSNYESDIRYVLERAAIEHPGFYLAESQHQRTDSPPEYCLKACLQEDSTSYVSQAKCSDRYYITIDNFLGKHQIVKKIDRLAETSEVKSLHQREAKPPLARIFAIAIVTSFFGSVYCIPLLFTLTQHSPLEKTSPERQAILDKLSTLRFQRTQSPIAPLAISNKLSSADRISQVERELKLLPVAKYHIDREMELNKLLLKDLKSKP
jgi:hypothetical protein